MDGIAKAITEGSKLAAEATFLLYFGLINVLVRKGIITRAELADEFRRMRERRGAQNSQILDAAIRAFEAKWPAS